MLTEFAILHVQSEDDENAVSKCEICDADTVY